MRWFIRRAWGRSIRRQLILGVALVHAVLMTLFIADLVLNQRRLLHSQALESAQSLAQALAVNSQSWVLSNDIMGLEEVVSAQRSYPDLRYGMVLSPDGRVLAHTARRHQGRYVTDEISARLLDTPPRLTRLVINEQLIDVAQPITARGELIGWARIGLSQARTNAGLRALTLEGLYYTILALILGSLFAYLLSRRITRDLYRLARVSTAFVAGDEGQRARLTGEDEISALGAAFDEMIDTVVEQRRETRDAQEALHAEKQRLAVVFDSITDAVISTDVCGRIILANKAAEKLISIENQHVLGIHVFNVCDFRCDHSENSCDDCIKNTLETKVKCSGQGEIFLKKTNKSFPVFRTSSPIFDDDGNAIGVVVVFRDIRDEIKQQEQLFKVKNLESIGVLAGGLAHDFNNILTGAIGNISLALLGINDQDDDQRDLLEGAESALLRATSLTQQLLTFSKGGNPVLEAASLSEIITETTRFILSGSALRCHFDIPEDLWRVRVDKGQIRQVVQNLALNAAQAMPHGGCLEIRCRNEEAPPLRGRVRIEFIDNGPGISPEALSRVFDPYFTTKPSGSGLGLAICHSIVNKHGGVISVDSSPQGTCFRFTLPAYFETISAPTRAAKAPLALNEAAAGRLIVIVDDEAAILEVGARMLRKVGFEVEVYPNGEALMAKRNTQEALRAVSAFILDLTIPGGMSGQAIAAAILKVDPQARLIVSSGYAHDPILSDFSAYGFTAQLKKPYTHEALQRVVTRTLSEALLS